MAIASVDVKILWAKAAGACRRPGCQRPCIVHVEGRWTVVGEMAHVIARRAAGPRGVSAGGEDTYENLILLCPSDHIEIDRAPSGAFTPELLHHWKREHEERVARLLEVPHFASLQALASYALTLLAENYAVWRTYGPDSKEAQLSPISTAAELWSLRKLSTIVPNNSKIAAALTRSRGLIANADQEHCFLFIEHAQGFERNCYRPTDGVPPFPKLFRDLMGRYAGTQ